MCFGCLRRGRQAGECDSWGGLNGGEPHVLCGLVLSTLNQCSTWTHPNTGTC